MSGGPQLELDWELGLFKALRALWRAVAPEPAPPWDPARAIHLESLLPSLTALARLVSGEALELAPAREGGGLRGKTLLLPAVVELGPTPEASREIYVLRVVHAATQRRLGLDRKATSDSIAALRWELHAAAIAAEAAAEEYLSFGPAWEAARRLALVSRPQGLRGRAALIERARSEALAGEHPWEDEALWRELANASNRGPDSPPVPLWGTLYLDPAEQESGEIPEDARHPSDGSEAEAPPVEEVVRARLDPRVDEQPVLLHTFEKVETADEHRGQSKTGDGADELEDQLEALREVKIREVTRGGPQAHSVLKAPIALEADVPDVSRATPDEPGIPYDEWDQRAGRYKPGWCTVYPVTPRASSPTWAAEVCGRHHALIDELVRRGLARRTRRSPERRQREGEDVDLDALVDHHADALAGHSGDARLYLRSLPRRRELATTVLLDVSLSSDGWVANRRVLDVTRESALVLAEVAARLGDDLQVLAFASHTRNHCRVFTLKRWDEPWAVAAGRLGALEPQGYTRIGPAIRHATALFRSRAAHRKLLLLLTDGKPTDHDRYEGRHGIADVRMAIRQAEAEGIVSHALAIDPSAAPLLPALVGLGSFTVLPTPDHLALAMAEVHARMSA